MTGEGDLCSVDLAASAVLSFCEIRSSKRSKLTESFIQELAVLVGQLCGWAKGLASVKELEKISQAEDSKNFFAHIKLPGLRSIAVKKGLHCRGI